MHCRSVNQCLLVRYTNIQYVLTNSILISSSVNDHHTVRLASVYRLINSTENVQAKTKNIQLYIHAPLLDLLEVTLVYMQTTYLSHVVELMHECLMKIGGYPLMFRRLYQTKEKTLVFLDNGYHCCHPYRYISSWQLVLQQESMPKLSNCTFCLFLSYYEE